MDSYVLGRNRDVSVSIEVHGNVSNSAITGVQIAESGTQRTLTGQLITRVLTEFLGLPTLTELASRLDVAMARWSGRGAELVGVEPLWQGLVGSYSRYDPFEGPAPASLIAHHDQAVCLREVVITPFINRVPGYQYVNSLRMTRARRVAEQEDLLTNEEIWISEGEAIRTLGLGDVRLGPSGGRYLCSAISEPTSRRFETDFARSELDFLISDKPPDNEELRYFGASHTAFGFPVVLDELVYGQLAEIFDQYGGAYVDSMTGTLRTPGSDFPLTWPTGVPKSILHVQDRHALRGLKPPNPFLAAAWTVVEQPETQIAKFAYWPFLLGTEHYMRSIRRASRIIAQAAHLRGYDRTLFEFDAQVNWFGDTTPITPRRVIDLYRSMERSDARVLVQRKHDMVNLLQEGTEEYISTTARGYIGVIDDAMARLLEADRLSAQGVAELQMEHWVAARDVLLKAAQVDIVYPWRWLFLGVCYWRLGAIAESAHAFAEAVEEATDDLLSSSELLRALAPEHTGWFTCLWLWNDHMQSRTSADTTMTLLRTTRSGSDTRAKQDRGSNKWDWWAGEHGHLLEDATPISTEEWDTWIVDRRAVVAVLSWWRALFGESIRLPFEQRLDALGRGDEPMLEVRHLRVSTPVLRTLVEASESVCVPYLLSASWRERKAAEFRLTTSGDPGVLAGMYDTSAASTRRVVARALGRIANARPEQRERVFSLLATRMSGERHVDILEDLIWTCGKTVSPHVPSLVSAYLVGDNLGDSDRLRQVALRALFWIGQQIGVRAQPSTPGASDLQDLFDGITSRWPHAPLVDTLLKGCASRVDSTRQICIMLLGEVGDERALEVLGHLQRTDSGSTAWGSNHTHATAAAEQIRSRMARGIG